MPFWKGKSNKFSAWISLNRGDKKTQDQCVIYLDHIGNKNFQICENTKGYGHKKKSFYKCRNVLILSKRVVVETEIGDVIIHHTKVMCTGQKKILRKKDRFALVYTYQPAK